MAQNIKSHVRMKDLDTLIAAGIDPKTGLPIRMGNPADLMKSNIKRTLRIADEQDAINRYTWYNLPDGLDGQLLERILYYKGQAAFFYIEDMKKFYFLPYALDGGIDVYGRFKGIRPLPFNGTTQDNAKGQEALKVWLNTQIKTPQYTIVAPEELDYDKLINSAVILKDYTEQISQNNIPRQQLQDPILDIMADCIPFMRTALLNSTGVEGMRVGDESEASNAKEASKSVENAALTGQKWIPMVGQVDFQDFAGSNVGRSEEFLLAMEGLDNFRLGLYGIDNGGLFQKKAHMLQDEQNMNASAVASRIQDGLTIRQKFCSIVNSIWGLGICCEISETVSGNDTNMDGQLQDDHDQSGMGNNAPENNGGIN